MSPFFGVAEEHSYGGTCKTVAQTVSMQVSTLQIASRVIVSANTFAGFNRQNVKCL